MSDETYTCSDSVRTRFDNVADFWTSRLLSVPTTCSPSVSCGYNEFYERCRTAQDRKEESISIGLAVVDCIDTPDRLDAGYSLTLSNGVVFTRSLLHDGYRRSLVTDISSIANGVGVGSLAYAYDALNRPTTRNNDTFGYNVRGEVVFSRRDEYPPAEGCPRSGCPRYNGNNSFQA